LSPTPDGGLNVKGPPSAIAEWAPVLKDNKPKIVAALQSNDFERRRSEIMALLSEKPTTPYAFVVDDALPDLPVIVAVGIRDIATFEMTIPRDRYDPFLFLQFLDGISSRHRH
jgi:hypothetical protein